MKVSIIGVGNMGSTILAGMLDKGIIKNDDVIISDINQERLQQVAEKFQVKSYLNNMGVVENQELIIIATKPKDARSVLKDIRPDIEENQIVISVVAGLTTATIERLLGEKQKIVRAMPNTPALIGAGITALAVNLNIALDERDFVSSLFETVGEVVHVQEKDLDIITGLSGSGPAYILTIIEALSDGGVMMGLSREVANQLSVQTVLGTSRLLISSGKHPAELREQVTSPGGTTCAGLYELEERGVRAAMIAAVEAATEKSKLLGLADE